MQLFTSGRRPSRPFLAALVMTLVMTLVMALMMALAMTASASVTESILEEARALRGTEPQAAEALLSGEIDALGPDADIDELFPLHDLRAQIARDLGRTDLARADAERLQALAEAADEPTRQAQAAYLYGTVLAEGGELARAVEKFHAARALFEEHGPDHELALVYNALAITHGFIGNFERSRDYYERALVVARQVGMVEFEITVLGNLAVAVADLDGPAASLELHYQALELAREVESQQLETYQLANLCSRLVQADRLEEAERVCPEALDAAEALGHNRILAGTRMSFGDLHRAQGRLDEALAAYESAMELARDQIGTVELPLLERLLELDETMGRPERALDHLRRLLELRERTLEIERERILEELELRFEVEQREREIEFLQLDAELQSTRLGRRNLMLAGALVALVLMVILALVAVRGFQVKSNLEQQLAVRNQELEKAVRTIGHMARRDPLTGLLNRGAFLASARHEQARRQRTGEPLSLVMADIDHFKGLNDQHGHPVGDEVLKQVAERLKAGMRKADVVARWGGEEFTFLLPGTGLAAAAESMERLREQFRDQPITTAAGRFEITLTFGIAPLGEDIEAAIQAADRALYEGKHGGRDRVVIVEGA